MGLLTIKEKIEDIGSYHIEGNDKHKSNSFCIEILTQLKCNKLNADDEYFENLNNKIKLKINNVIRYHNITGYGFADELCKNNFMNTPLAYLKINLTYFTNTDIKFYHNVKDNKKHSEILKIEDIIIHIINEINDIKDIEVAYAIQKR